MTLDEAIKHAEEVAEEQEKAAKEWHENQVRKCELIRFAEMDYTHENECKKCADEHRQLAEWLKDYKRLLEQQSSEDSVSRKAVFETIDDCNSDGLKGIFCSYDDGERFKEYIKKLSPVTPTHKVGMWIFTKTIFDKYGSTVECQSCRKKWKTYDEIRWKKENKFCPNCGTDMRGAENESK